jgi:hypothetical protein
MRVIAIFVFFVLAQYAICNDTNYILTAGGNEITVNEVKQIKLINESIDISMYRNYFNVVVKYIFENKETTSSVNMSFPEFEVGDSSWNPYFDGGISRFDSFIDGERANIEIVNDNGFIGPTKLVRIKRFFKKEVLFKPGTIKIENRYTNRYSAGPMGCYYALYLYGTAKAWGGIKNIDVAISVMDPSVWIMRDPYSLVNGEKIEAVNNLRIEKGVIKFTIEANTSNEDSIFAIQASEYGKAGILFDFDPNYSQYSKEEIKYLSANQIRILRNFIYAFHGYIFKSNDLNKIFYNESWYKPNNDFNESNLTDNEKKQIENLFTVEKSRDW